MLIPKAIIIRDEKHRRFIAFLPCCISGIENYTQCAHIRHGNSGIGLKSGDNYTVPLSWQLHQAQHHIGSEVKFWEPYGGIDKVKHLALSLYENTQARQECLNLLKAFKDNY